MIQHQISNSRKDFQYNSRLYTDVFWHSHYHGNFELIFMISGSIELFINSEMFTLCEGEAFLIEPYAVHSFFVPQNAQAWVGVFSDEYVSAFSGKYQNVQFSPFRLSAESEILLKEKLFTENVPDVYLLTAYLNVVCSECVANAKIISGFKNSGFMKEVIDYVSENLAQSISMSTLALSMGYEYHYFSALFHKSFGEDFKKFVNRFRVYSACEYLAAGVKSITEICGICGFASIRNFNRAFKEVMNITPTEYQKKH